MAAHCLVVAVPCGVVCAVVDLCRQPRIGLPGHTPGVCAGKRKEKKSKKESKDKDKKVRACAYVCVRSQVLAGAGRACTPAFHTRSCEHSGCCDAVLQYCTTGHAHLRRFTVTIAYVLMPGRWVFLCAQSKKSKKSKKRRRSDSGSSSSDSSSDSDSEGKGGEGEPGGEEDPNKPMRLSDWLKM